MSRYRIIKYSYESGEVRYQIQQKFLCIWIDVGGEYWETLDFAKERLRQFEGNKILSKSVIS